MEPKRAYKSFRYQNQLEWTRARRGTLAAPGKTAIEVGSPPEFKGEEGVWSPEEMLVGAVNACLMLTFAAFADHRKLVFTGYTSRAEGLLENVDGKYRITEVSVQPLVTLQSEADLSAAREIFGGLEENCFITNSITARVTVTPELRLAT
jgi:organic hydroperoxide reductase OsmC/OhrA